MKRLVWLLGVTLLMASGCGNDDFPGVRQLIERRVPWLSERVELCEEESSGSESFTLRSDAGKLCIAATSANAAAVGVNWYLNHYCGRSMSHMGDNLGPVDDLPLPEAPVTVTTDLDYRYALNYCTFNYSMSFYTWEDWERELDWMALHGVNLMLVANGAEAVWQNTLRRLGYSEERIASFLSGPAYNAWWLMGNLEGWGGPMPQSQIDARAELVRKMLGRMRKLGIEPLMPGFYGMVPHDYGSHAGVRVFDQGNWGAFTRPAILDPTTPEFARVASIFYEETRRLYGDGIRFFSGDPFHEGGSVAGVDMGEAGLAIQRAMQEAFPESVWVLQGWQDNPKPQLLERLDRRYVLVQELFGENTANWEQREAYEGTPFLWATVTNFGERPGVNGKLQRFADEVHRASTGPYASCMRGVGILPEGIVNNPVVYDLVLELPWHRDRVDVAEWIEGYVKARYGRCDERLTEAWRIFLETIHSSTIGYQEGPPENVLCARPGLGVRSVSSWGRLEKRYDTARFAEGVRLMASARADFAGSETYRIDLINMLRQVIANRADGVYADLSAACERRDRDGFRRASSEFLALHDLEEELLAQDPLYRIDTYQKQALAAGRTPSEKDNNLYNAMMLITYWGENNPAEDYLHDYAYKEWAGLMTSFYKRRWEMWFDYVQARLDGGTPERPEFFFWEREWAENNRKVMDCSPSLSFEEVLGRMEGLLRPGEEAE